MAASPTDIFQTMLGGIQSGQRIRQGQQELELRKQQEMRANQQADMEFHQHMVEMGALPIINGMVKDTEEMHPLVASMLGTGQQAPAGNAPGDAPGAPQPTASSAANAPVTAAGNLTIVRKADPANTVKWKDATGDPVAYELPSVGSQRWRQMMNIRAQAQASSAQANEQGQLAGKTQGMIADRAARAQPISDDEADSFAMPHGTKMTPEELLQAHERYFTVDRARIMAAAADSRAKARADLQQSLADQRGALTQELADKKLGYQDSWQKARTALAGQTQGSLNARAQLRSLDSAQSQHGKYLDMAYREGQRQLEAQALVGETQEPGFMGMGAVTTPVVPDGQEFTDPWSSKKTTMNQFQRARIKAGLQSSSTQVQDWLGRAQQIEKQYGLQPPTPPAANATPGATVSPAAGGSPAAASPVAPPTRPQSTAPRRKVGEIVTLKNGKRMTITKVNPDGSYEGQ